MPRSRPPLFDDEHASRAHDEHHDRFEHPGQPAHPGQRNHPDPGPEPNYLLRRALVVGALVAVIVLAATAVGWFFDDRAGPTDATFTSVEWNTVALVDPNTGTVALADDTGTETSRARLDVRGITDARNAGATLVATTDTEVAIAQLDDTELANAQTIEMSAVAPILMPSGSAQTLIVRDTSGERAVFVHGPTGEVIDSDDFAIVGARYDTQLARSDSAGRHVLVTDTGNFQSVLFSFDRSEASFFLGLALAVDDTAVVTAQNVGNAATLSVYDHAGQLLTSATTASVRGAMLTPTDVVVVTANGDVNVMSRDSGDISKVGELTIGTVEAGHVSPRGDRLVMIGSDGTSIVDDAGGVLAEVVDAVPTSTGIDAIAPRRNECLIVAQPDRDDITVVGLETGRVHVVAFADFEVFAGADGCAPIAPTPIGYQLLSSTAIARTTVAGDIIAVSPDGATLVTDSRSRLSLVPRITGDDDTDAELPDPVDLGRSGQIVLFADL